MKVSPGQLRQIIKLIKDAPAVTPRVITVDHIADLQPGDIVISLGYPEAGYVTVNITVLRNEKGLAESEDGS